MTRDRALRLWPVIGALAMLILGFAVRGGPIALDDWFQDLGRTPVGWLAVAAGPWLNALVLAAVVAVALTRRWWRTALVALGFPPAAYVLVQLLKRVVNRWKEDGLAYPSGHVTVTVVVWGLVIVVAGWALWAVVTGIAVCLLGMVGVGSTFHYVTDTFGGVLLGTAIVCLAALITKPDLTRVNPDAICVTRGR